MTEEELTLEIATLIVDEFSLYGEKGLEHADKVACMLPSIFREAGFLTPDMVKGLMFEVQAQKCAKCPKNKEGQP